MITDKQIKDAENAAYKVSGHRASDAWTRAFAEALAASIAAHVFPAQLTTPLREVLGLMLWQTTPISHALRAAFRRSIAHAACRGPESTGSVQTCSPRS